MKTNAGFDLLAPVYDSLARFIFGKSIVDSQTRFLDHVPSNSNVLIIGGGTGWLLEKLQRHKTSVIVYYVEASNGMLEKARHRTLRNRVHFIHGTEESIPPGLKADVVITNFYLDLFSDTTLEKVVHRITLHTRGTSVWLTADFVNNKWWHQWMLTIMYLFFRKVCRIEGRRLPEWKKHISNQGWTEVHSQRWYGNFIESVVWHRQ